jgi:hypothetical protein
MWRCEVPGVTGWSIAASHQLSSKLGSNRRTTSSGAHVENLDSLLRNLPAETRGGRIAGYRKYLRNMFCLTHLSCSRGIESR